MQHRLIILFVLITCTPLVSQRFLGAILYSYGTSQTVYPFPTSEEIQARSYSIEFNRNQGGAFFLQTDLTEEFSLHLLCEYLPISKSSGITAQGAAGTVALNTEEKSLLIPIEFAAGYKLPFSGENFLITIYSGIGYYPATYSRTVGTLSSLSSVDNNTVNFISGVFSGLRIFDNIFVVLDIRFRDPDVYFINKYSSLQFSYQAETYQMKNERFNTRVNLNGIYFLAGVGYRF